MPQRRLAHVMLGRARRRGAGTRCGPVRRAHALGARGCGPAPRRRAGRRRRRCRRRASCARGDDAGLLQHGGEGRHALARRARAGPTAGNGLNGIRLNLHGTPMPACCAPARPAARACSGWSLTPSSMQYSKVMKSRGARVEVALAGVQQLGDRVLAVQRHQLVAQRVVRARAATPPAPPGSRRAAGRSSAPRPRSRP